MSETDQPMLATLRKRRGVIKASITRLNTRLNDLESKIHEPTTSSPAQRMLQTLDTLNADFKKHHYAVIDRIDEADVKTLGSEQDALDQHDDGVSILAMQIEQVIGACSLTSGFGARKIVSRRLSYLKNNLSAVNTAVHALTAESAELHLLHQYQEQLSDFKKELGDIRQTLLSLGVEEGDELETSTNAIDKVLFDCSLQLKKLLFTLPNPISDPLMESSATMASGVKLPKIDVPTFDGNILSWQTFWEQFSIAIHKRSSLSDTEKLVYLRHSLKDGAAKKVIEDMSPSGDQYAKAIMSLKSRYDCPRLIHQIHVKKIVEIAPLKEGSGKELRYLHDTAQQHLRALKAMGQEPSGSFITSLLELKLDQNTMFEWQKCSQESSEVPHYKDLLEFINLRAQASESVSSETKKFIRTEHHLPKRVPPSKPGPIVSIATSASNTDNCALCKNEKHPLYVCTRFKSLPRDKMMSTIKSNELCFNCLRPGHFSKQCPSLNLCSKCQKPHHTLIHDDSKETLPSQSDKTLTSSTSSTEPTVLSHTAAGVTSNTLLMTCQVLVKAPDNSSVKAHALLDSASSTSFVSELRVYV